MKLPSIDYTSAQPAMPYAGTDPNERRKLNLQALAVGFGVFDAVKTSLDDAETTKQNAIVANQMQQVDDYLTSGDRVNINDPRMPEEIRSQIMTNLDQNDPDITVDGEQTFVPTSRVTQPVLEYYQGKLNESVKDIPIRNQAEYAALNQNAYDKVSQRATTAQKGFVLADMQKSYDAGINQMVQAGDMDGALYTLSKARNSGVLSDDQVAKYANGIVTTFTNRYATQLEGMTNELGAAAYAGNAQGVQAAQDQMNNHIANALDVGLITPEEANTAVQKADSSAEKLRFRGEVTRLFDSKGIQAANNALRVYENRKPPNVSQEDWLKTIDAARVDINKRYSDEQKIKADMKDISKKDMSIANAMLLVNAGMPVVGKDAEQGMDDAYESSLQYQWADPANQYKWAEDSYRIVERTGYMPKGLKDDLVRMVNNGAANPANAALAGSIYSRIQQLPTAVDDIESMQDDVLLQEVAANTRAGLPPQQAYEVAAKTVAIDPTTRKTRNEAWAAASGDYKKTMKRINNASNEIYDQWFKDDPKKAEAYTVQFRDLERSAYLLTGDMDKASKYAADKLNKVWRVTDLNGERELMQFAPESVYPQFEGSSKWVKEDLDKYKQKQLPDLVAKYGAENIIIESDYYTTHTPTVSYAVKVRDPNQLGVTFNATDANNLRRRWYPDIEQNPDYQLNNKVRKDELNAQRSDLNYQRTVFDRAMVKLGGIDSIASNSDASPDGQFAHIKEKSVPLLIEAFAEIENDPAMKKGGGTSRGDVYDREAMAAAKAGVQEAYNRKMLEVSARLKARHEQKVKEYQAKKTVAPNRGNPAGVNYMPDM